MGLNKIRLPNGISDSLIRYSGLLLVEGDALEVDDGDVVLLEDILNEFFGLAHDVSLLNERALFEELAERR